MSQVTDDLIKEISKSFAKYPSLNREEKVVEDFCKKFINRQYFEKGSLIRVRSGFVHRNPMVRLMNTSLGVTKCELGDILFILKVFIKKKLITHKASLEQVKISTKTTFEIPLHQWMLYKDFQTYPFIFGQQKWMINPHSKYFANFLLSNLTEFDLVNNRRPLPKNYIVNSYSNKIKLIPVYADLSLLTLEIFLNKFTQGLIAEEIRTVKMKKFIESLYKFCELIPDPPDEFKEDIEPGGFGIIEITIDRGINE